MALLVLIMFGCSPKVVQKVIDKHEPLQENDSFIVFNQDEKIDLSEEKIIGDIQIKDAGLTIDCDLETVLNLAKSRAKTIGGNAMQIYEFHPPDRKSTCYRIKAKVMWLKNISLYEREIIWSTDRKLKISDFKGSILNRPFLASTSSEIKYKFSSKPFSKIALFKVETSFNCVVSYFKLDNDSLNTLEHEQLHFNITELYARKLTKRIKEEVLTAKELPIKCEKIFREITQETYVEQDKYDSETYSDRTKQGVWNAKIAKELEKYSAFEKKEIQIKI